MMGSEPHLLQKYTFSKRDKILTIRTYSLGGGNVLDIYTSFKIPCISSQSLIKRNSESPTDELTVAKLEVPRFWGPGLRYPHWKNHYPFGYFEPDFLDICRYTEWRKTNKFLSIPMIYWER